MSEARKKTAPPVINLHLDGSEVPKVTMVAHRFTVLCALLLTEGAHSIHNHHYDSYVADLVRERQLLERLTSSVEGTPIPPPIKLLGILESKMFKNVPQTTEFARLLTLVVDFLLRVVAESFAIAEASQKKTQGSQVPLRVNVGTLH